MKLKGINWFELNVEKIVLGVGGLALAGVFGLQMFTQPNMIKVGTEMLTPPRAVDPVNREAQRVADQMVAAEPVLPPQPSADLLPQLTMGLTQPLTPSTQRVALGRPLGIGQGKGGGPVEVEYAGVSVPAPTNATAVAFANTINPLEAARAPDLAAVLPKEQPFDKGAVTVGAMFNGQALREALLADPDGPGPLLPIPRAWWSNPLNPGDDQIDIIAVQIQRETVTPAEESKEAPGATAAVPPMPGREDSMKMWTTDVKGINDMSSALFRIRAMGDQVPRPPYYSTIAGQPWAEPDELAAILNEGGDKAAKIERLKKEIEKIDKAIADLEQKIAMAPDASQPGAGGPGGDREPPPGGGRGRLGGPGGPGGPPPGPRPSTPTLNKKGLEAQLKRWQADKTKKQRDLAAEGVAVKEAALPQGAPGTPPPPPMLLESAEYKIWAHDLTAVPGSTYRYRIRVVVNNPLFGRALKDSQKALAAKSYVEGPWSEWSNPVEVDRSDYFFITNASDGKGNAVSPLPHASAELYKFFYGYWRKAIVGLDPGDKLQGVAKLPELHTFQLPKQIADAGQPVPGQPPQPPPPQVPGRRIGGPDALQPGGGPRVGGGPPGPGGPPPGPQGPEIEGATKVAVPKDLPIEVEAYFLDSARVPVGAGVVGNVNVAREVFEAILRGVGGNVIARIPEEDRGQARYQRLVNSEKLGKTQGQPTVKPVDPQTNPGGGPKPPKPPPDPGKGGGGGG